MSNASSTHQSAAETPASQRGYRHVLGSAFLLLGALHFGFSLLAVLLPAFPGAAGEQERLSLMASLAVSYLRFQVWSGLLLGPLTMAAGWLMRQGRHLNFQRLIAALNLILFPHGTTIGILALVGLSRRRLQNAFHS